MIIYNNNKNCINCLLKVYKFLYKILYKKILKF